MKNVEHYMLRICTYKYMYCLWRSIKGSNAAKIYPENDENFPIYCVANDYSYLTADVESDLDIWMRSPSNLYAFESVESFFTIFAHIQVLCTAIYTAKECRSNLHGSLAHRQSFSTKKLAHAEIHNTGSLSSSKIVLWPFFDAKPLFYRVLRTN